MKIAVIGKGKMGSSLAELARKAGHTVTVGSRDPKQPVLAAIKGVDMVVLAVPYAEALALADNKEIAKNLAGKILVDITNPLAPDYMSLTVGHTTSAAEEIAKRLSGVKVVKAFNTIFADVLKTRLDGGKGSATVLVAGNDEAAKKAVTVLATSFGFESVDAGNLLVARYLEPLAQLQIQLAYGKGKGTKIGFSLVTAG